MIEGPYIILSNGYYPDGSLDYDALVRQAEFASEWDIPGVIWPQSNDAVDLLSKEEKFKGMAVLAEAWGRKRYKTRLTLGISGDDIPASLENAREAERLASEWGLDDLVLCARPPYYGRSQDEIRSYYEALAGVVRHPVIIQTYVIRDCPAPDVELLIDLARKYPDIYGWIKEESNDMEANERQRRELGSPYVKTVFSARGGWQWLYQHRIIGTRGLISERIAYCPIIGYIWKCMQEGDPCGRLTQAFAMYRLLIDQRNFNCVTLRGYSLHYMERLGLLRNSVSRDYIEKIVTPGGTYPVGDKSRWKLVDFPVSEEECRELDKCYDDMLDFVNEKHD